ncbi:MAG: type I-A CRISPR-associated protein Cas5 [bacterium]|nr:type I-A CRISPR-associated protein Cas5 [bacterium]
MSLGFLVEVEFDWGYQCKVAGLSRGSAAYLYPPPTSILGALAESIARKEGLGEKQGLAVLDELGKHLLALGIRPVNCMPIKFSDISRIITVKITSGQRFPHPELHSFDAPAIAKTMLSPVTVDEKAPLLCIVLVFDTEKIVVDKREILLEEEYFWRIHRIGSKESRVSVLEVKEKEAEIVQQKNLVLRASFPLMGVDVKQEYGRWLTEVYLDPASLNYRRTLSACYQCFTSEQFIAYKLPVLEPGKEPQCIVELEKGAAYKVENEVVVGRPCSQ